MYENVYCNLLDVWSADIIFPLNFLNGVDSLILNAASIRQVVELPSRPDTTSIDVWSSARLGLGLRTVLGHGMATSSQKQQASCESLHVVDFVV